MLLPPSHTQHPYCCYIHAQTHTCRVVNPFTTLCAAYTKGFVQGVLHGMYCVSCCAVGVWNKGETLWVTRQSEATQGQPAATAHLWPVITLRVRHHRF